MRRDTISLLGVGAFSCETQYFGKVKVRFCTAAIDLKVCFFPFKICHTMFKFIYFITDLTMQVPITGWKQETISQFRWGGGTINGETK